MGGVGSPDGLVKRHPVRSTVVVADVEVTTEGEQKGRMTAIVLDDGRVLGNIKGGRLDIDPVTGETTLSVNLGGRITVNGATAPRPTKRIPDHKPTIFGINGMPLGHAPKIVIPR